MKRVLIATCVALAFAVNLAAQAPASQDKPQPTAGQSAAADKGVTLKGCLRAGESPDSFVLANAAPAAAAAGTAGTAGAAATPAAAKTVRLIGAPAGTNLKEHVGHTVEITGMITPATSSTPAAPSAPAAGGAAASAASESLNVKTFKHVEGKCQ